jgi:hypothetical protein
MSDPQTRRLATLLADKTNQRGSQLAFSSLEDGAIREFDVGGALVAMYGAQWDGTHTAASLNGPTPPHPSAPIVAGVPGGLLVGWDGFFADGPTVVAPMDFARVDVSVGPVGFDPIATPPTTAFMSPRGGSVFISKAVGTYEVALITRTQSGGASTVSTIVSGTAAALTGTAEDATARALAQQAIDDAAAAAAAAAAAQIAADAAATIYRQATAPASGMVANDMWIDSDDGLLYVYVGSTWTLSADQRIADLVTTTGTKITLFAQASAPTTTGRTEGDIWVDTDDGNKVYVWTWGGTGWTARTFGSAAISATARQLGAVTIYRQSTAPASGMITNDLWVDSDDGLLYIYTGTWTLSADQRIATLVTSNATKITLFTQTSAPSTSGRTNGDIWIDTDDGNLIYIWTGTWENKRDTTIAAADAKAVQALADAATAAAAAAAASGAAQTALDSANGKNSVTHSTTAPTNEANVIDDVWFVRDAEGNIVGQYVGLGGTSWAPIKITHQVIASVDLGTATVGKLAANFIESGVLDAAIAMTGYLLAGNPAGARVVIDDAGIRQYTAAGAILVNIPTDPLLPAQFEGTVLASSMTILNNFALRGVDNEISKGARLALSSGTTSPTSPPSIAVGYQTYDPARWNYLFIPAGVHGDVDDSPDVIGAMFFFGYGKFIGKSGAYWSGAEYTDSTGTKRNMWGQMGAASPVAVGGAERLVVRSIYTSGNGATAAGQIGSFDLAPMNSSGTAAPLLKTSIPVVVDSLSFYVRLGRVFSGVGSTLYNDRVAMAMLGWNGTTYENGMIHLRQYTVTDSAIGFAAGATSVTVVSPLAAGEELIGVTHGSSDKLGYPGAAQYLWLLHGKNKTYAYNALATSRLPEYDFPTPAGAARMMAWGSVLNNGFVGFRTTSHSDVSVVTKLTNNHWFTGTSDKWWVSSTWYDSDVTDSTHESTQGPRASITMKKRAGLVITVPPYPERPTPTTTDDVIAARVYLARGTNDPGRTNMERVAELTAPNRSGSVGNFTFPAGAAASPPPAASNFPASAPARVSSADDVGWILTGDGKATLAGVEFDAVRPGFKATSMRPQDTGLVGTAQTTTSTSMVHHTSGPSIVFTAPPSGVVRVDGSFFLKSSVDGQFTEAAVFLRTGGTVTGGTLVDTQIAATNYNVQWVRSAGYAVFTGLTPGSTYHVYVGFKSGTGTNTASISTGRLTLTPLP